MLDASFMLNNIISFLTGRTGRCGKTGVATTFINKDVDESILLDLKHLLIEAKQRVPPVLQALGTFSLDNKTRF